MVYGVQKVHAELNLEAVPVTRCDVEQPMSQEGIQGIRRDKILLGSTSAGW